MKLKTCKNIEIALHIVKAIFLIPIIPFALLGAVFMAIWNYPSDWLCNLVWKISNKMLCNCDEVKNGTIKDRRYKNLSSREAYIWLKQELQNYYEIKKTRS